MSIAKISTVNASKSAPDTAREATSFTLEHFSTYLLVECILQHLEGISIPKTFINTANGAHWDDIRKWVRLAETLLTCLKSDVKNFKSRCSGGVGGGHPCGQPSCEARDTIATIISQWFPDLQELKTIYTENEDQFKVHKEIEHLYHHVDTLYNLSLYIYVRDKQKNQTPHEDAYKREEVVFLYDDVISEQSGGT